MHMKMTTWMTTTASEPKKLTMDPLPSISTQAVCAFSYGSSSANLQRWLVDEHLPLLSRRQGPTVLHSPGHLPPDSPPGVMRLSIPSSWSRLRAPSELHSRDTSWSSTC